MKPAVNTNVVKLLLGMAVAGVVLVVAIALRFALFQTVWFVNGLPVSVQVQLDDSNHGFTLQSQQREARAMLVGVHAIRVLSPEGKLLSDETVAIPSRHDVVAYNVLGAAPLATVPTVYTSGSHTGTHRQETRIHAGRRLIAQDGVQYVFTPPPSSISVDSRSSASEYVRWQFDLIGDNWQDSVRMASEDNRLDDTVAICLGLLDAHPGDPGAVDCLLAFLPRTRGLQAAQVLLRQLVEQSPGDVELQRDYQFIGRRLDRWDAMRTEYRTWLATHPDDHVIRSMLARLEPRAQAESMFREVLAKDPSNKVARRGLAMCLRGLGRFAESAREFSAMQDTDPDYPHYVEDHIRALLANGQAAEAIRVVQQVVEKTDKPNWRFSLLHAQLVRWAGKDAAEVAPNKYIDKITGASPDPTMKLFLQAMQGEEIPPAKLQPLPRQLQDMIRLHVTAAHNPAHAWDLIQGMSPDVLSHLDDTMGLLLAAEFERVGDSSTAHALFAHSAHISLPTYAVRDYVVHGKEHPEFWRLEEDERTALAFVRLRSMDPRSEQARKLAQVISTRVVLNGLLAVAMRSWPAPAEGSWDLVLLRKQLP